MPQDHFEKKQTLPARRNVEGNPVPSRHVQFTAGPPKDARENLISPAFIVWVLRQWWLVVIPIGLVLAVVSGGIVMYSYSPKYEATALLMIEDVGQFVAFSNRDGGQSQRYVQTQLELLRSPVVLEPVLGRSEIAAIGELTDDVDPVKSLRDHLTVKQV